MTSLELLAPAKNLECGIAAIDHGADAVYIGASRFGARSAAGNSIDDIRQLCEYAHPFGVKVYVTVNTILYDDELDATRQLLQDLQTIGVDAILVQDMAVLEILRSEECGVRSENTPATDAPLQSNLTSHSTLLTPRIITTPSHYTYIKISEGCDRHCAYCAIPLITGRHKSRSMEEILDEVRQLVKQGTKEFNVIAQELTYYGVDIDGRQHIAELIEQMADIPGVAWIRLHYAYPTHFPWDLLRVMREKPNVCKYLDIALQHISDNVLSRMQRHVTKAETYELVERLRKEVPGIHIRTTLMVGFPGETEENFEELKAFVKWARFERMGAFAYSEEEGTYSEQHYDDDVPEEVKQRRLDQLMRIQQHISEELEAEKVDKTLKVIIDRQEGDYYVGRTEFCSPEVDPEVLIPVAERELTVGMFYDVLITDSAEFDLYGTTIIL